MLLQHCRENKLSSLALFSLACEIAAEHGIEHSINLSAVCATLGVNRTQIYEKRTQLAAQLDTLTLAGRGRPRHGAVSGVDEVSGARSLSEAELRIAHLEFRLTHPDAVLFGTTGRGTYSDGFKRFVLDADDRWSGTDLVFCRAMDIPRTTLTSWRELDAKEPILPAPVPSRIPEWPADSKPNEAARTIVTDFNAWSETVAKFLGYEARKLHVSPAAIRSVLRIAGMLSPSDKTSPRYRGSTEKASPGAIAVTDGKDVRVKLSSSEEVRKANWQAMVDQATTCHLAVVVTPTESAAAVWQAHDEATEFLGRSPLAMLHDQKPVYAEAKLREHIERTTTMIPATPSRPENKAVIEGEFGKFERDVGTIVIDDSNKETLATSVVREVLRGYTSGINHARRVEFDGKSRIEVVREACPDPKKDLDLISKLKANHGRGHRPADPLPTAPIARSLLNEGFRQFDLAGQDASTRLRDWLATRFEPEAVRRALAIFGAKWEAGALRSKHAVRYLVKLIQGAQIELDLEREERLLLKFAEAEKRAWLISLETALTSLRGDCPSAADLAMRVADHALFGGIFLEKAFWEQTLEKLLDEKPALTAAVLTHIRRLFEAPPLDRRRLMNRLITRGAHLDRQINSFN